MIGQLCNSDDYPLFLHLYIRKSEKNEVCYSLSSSVPFRKHVSDPHSSKWTNTCTFESIFTVVVWLFSFNRGWISSLLCNFKALSIKVLKVLYFCEQNEAVDSSSQHLIFSVQHCTSLSIYCDLQRISKLAINNVCFVSRNGHYKNHSINGCTLAYSLISFDTESYSHCVYDLKWFKKQTGI